MGAAAPLLLSFFLWCLPKTRVKVKIVRSNNLRVRSLVHKAKESSTHNQESSDAVFRPGAYIVPQAIIHGVITRSNLFEENLNVWRLGKVWIGYIAFLKPAHPHFRKVSFPVIASKKYADIGLVGIMTSLTESRMNKITPTLHMSTAGVYCRWMSQARAWRVMSLGIEGT